LADILYIYPNKRKKKSFENKRDEILRNGLEAAISGRNNDNAATKTGRTAK
jgi:plasmid stability protein